MTNLTSERLEQLNQERLAKGLANVVTLLKQEELTEYKERVIASIEKIAHIDHMADLVKEKQELLAEVEARMTEVETAEEVTFEELLNQVERIVYSTALSESIEGLGAIEEKLGKVKKGMNAGNIYHEMQRTVSMTVCEMYLRNYTEEQVKKYARNIAKNYRTKEEEVILTKTGKVIAHNLKYNFNTMNCEGYVQGENGIFKVQKIVAAGSKVSAHTRYIIRKQSKMTSL